MAFHKINSLSYSILHELLSGELPGKEAHKTMLPQGRDLALPKDESLISESAVLVLILQHQNTLNLCLIRRSSNLKNHAGQIGFPGGRRDKTDPDHTATALREAHEEIGIEIEHVKILGRLTPIYVQVSNFNITPIVGWCASLPLLQVNFNEVEELLFIPLQQFIHSKNIRNHIVETQRGLIEAPCYQIENIIIWGATAMIIAELTALLNSHFRYSEECCNNDDTIR